MDLGDIPPPLRPSTYLTVSLLILLDLVPLYGSSRKMTKENLLKRGHKWQSTRTEKGQGRIISGPKGLKMLFFLTRKTWFRNRKKSSCRGVHLPTSPPLQIKSPNSIRRAPLKKMLNDSFFIWTSLKAYNKNNSSIPQGLLLARCWSPTAVPRLFATPAILLGFPAYSVD